MNSRTRLLRIINHQCGPATNRNWISQRQQLQHQSSASSSSSNNDNNDGVVSRQQVLDEAAALTKSLYRLCIRSTQAIRHGNIFDEKEFEKREEEWANPSASGGSGVMSMAPPPDREDELRSRTEYYQAYAREYFVQESDCFNQDPLREKDVRRYLYYLKKGEKDRKWLLGDMMFSDPYKGKFDFDRVNQFEMLAMKHLGLEVPPVDDSMSTIDKEEGAAEPNDDDDFFDEEEEDPDWLKKKYPHLK